MLDVTFWAPAKLAVAAFAQASGLKPVKAADAACEDGMETFVPSRVLDEPGGVVREGVSVQGPG